MAKRLELPALGQTMEEGTIIRWFKAEGESIEKGDPLYEVMTDKVNMEVETPVSGVVLKILAPVDSVVPVNSGVAIIGKPEDSIEHLLGEPGNVIAASVPESPVVTALPPPVERAATAPVPVSPAPIVTVAAPAPQSHPAPAAAPSAVITETRVFASPRARRAADVYGIDLEIAGITGTGEQGRITESDVIAAYDALRRQRPASPLAQRVAAEHGLALDVLTGSGQGGKVLHDDVRKHITASESPAAPAPPAVSAPATPNGFPPIPKVWEMAASGQDSSETNGSKQGGRIVQPEGETTVIPLAGMRKMIADTVSRSASTIPHVTLTIPVDMSEAIRFRQQVLPAIEKTYGVRVSITDIIAKAAARALQDHPILNSTCQNNQITLHRGVHLGIAVSLGAEGLIVPVIRDAQAMNLGEFSSTLKDRAARAKAGELSLDEVSGGTFSITNLGTTGVTQFNPIINPPQAAILGVCSTVDTVVAVNGQPQVRPMMNLCLSFDHRVTDGAPASAYLAQLKGILEQPYLMFA